MAALERTVSDLRIVVYRPQFKSMPYADAVLAKVHQYAEQAKSDVQLVNDIVTSFLHTKRESGRLRAEKVVSSKEVQKSSTDFRTFTRNLQRLQTAIEGRDDWSRPSSKESNKHSPKESSRQSPQDNPLPSPQSENDGSKKKSSNLAPPAAARVTISAPASPLQPFVEEVEDDPEEETHNVRAYHFIHPSDSVAEPSRRVMATPPPVIVRAPTEPMTEDDIPRPDSKDSWKDSWKVPLKSALKRPSPPPGSSRTPEPEVRSVGIPGMPSIVTRTPEGMALKEAQMKARELEAELEELRSPDNSPYPTPLALPTRTQRVSVDLSSNTLHPDSQPRRPGRQRAYTATGLERPKEYKSSSESDRRPSPRHSPTDPTDGYHDGNERLRASPRRPARHHDHSPRLGTFDPQEWSRPKATDGRTSLPSGIDLSQQPSDSHSFSNRPSTSSMKSPRSKNLDRDYDDFFRQGEDKAGDFSLFDDAAESSEAQARRSPRHSPRGSPTSREVWRPVIEHELHITLEELFTGAVRTANINRRVHGVEEDLQVRIPIYPGLKPGSKIKFAGKGDVTDRGKQDIHFIVRQAPHVVFEWRERDLYATVELPLAAALLGWEKSIRTVCGKTVRVSHPGPTQPGWKEYYAGLGMCSRKDPNLRGDMIVTVNIVWPRTGGLSDRQKELIRQALMPGTPRNERAGGAGVY